MKQTLIPFLSLFLINFLSAQNIERIMIPKGIVYNYCDSDLVEKAKLLIKENIVESNKYSILQDTIIIGPELWNRFKNIKNLQDIKGNVSFHVDDKVLSGKRSLNFQESKLIWDELKKEVTGDYKIRKANEKELNYYWSVISFDIDEPLLIVETAEHNYILNLLKSDLKLLWLDESPMPKEYYNPIENKNYIAENGFKKYQNGTEVNSISKGIKETKLEKVILLSSDKELKENSSVEDIQKIIEKTESIFLELFKNSEKSGKIMVQFELEKKENKIQFAVKDELDLEIMKKFEKKINKTKYPNSRKDSVKIQLVLKVNSFDDTE